MGNRPAFRQENRPAGAPGRSQRLVQQGKDKQLSLIHISPTSGSLVTITGIEEVYVKFPISERDFLSLFGTQDNMKKEAVVTLTLANGKAYAHPGKVLDVYKRQA